MNIGLVVEHLDPRRGGVEQWTWQFAQRVAALGHRIHVIAQTFGPQPLGDRIIAHPLGRARSRLEFAAAAEAQARWLNLDVVHDTGCGWYCDVFQPHGGSRTAAFEQNLLLAPGWLRTIKRHGARWLPRYREFDRLVDRQYNNRDATFLAISRMVADDLRRHHRLPNERVALVYNGVDLERFSPGHRVQYRARTRHELRIGDGEVLLLIVAHNFRLKGVPTLLRSTARLAGEGQAVRLVVAGGKNIVPWQRAARRLGIGARTTFLGSIDDPVPYYAAADVYVQPTFYDPCSLVVLEALASGLPVVTSRFNGAGELITAGREGFVIDDPGNDGQLAGALRPLLEAGRRAAMSTAARRLAEDHSLDRNCREILALYERSAGHRHRAA